MKKCKIKMKIFTKLKFNVMKFFLTSFYFVLIQVWFQRSLYIFFYQFISIDHNKIISIFKSVQLRNSLRLYAHDLQGLVFCCCNDLQRERAILSKKKFVRPQKTYFVIP